MEALEVAMEKHNIHVEKYLISTSSSKPTLSACGCQTS